MHQFAWVPVLNGSFSSSIWDPRAQFNLFSVPFDVWCYCQILLRIRPCILIVQCNSIVVEALTERPERHLQKTSVRCPASRWQQGAERGRATRTSDASRLWLQTSSTHGQLYW